MNSKENYKCFRDWLYERYLPCENPSERNFETGHEFDLLAHDMERAKCPVDTDRLEDYVDHMTTCGAVDPLVYGAMVKAFVLYKFEHRFMGGVR